MSLSSHTPDAPTPPALVIPCSGVAARPVSDTHAEVVLQNTMVHASLVVDAEQLRGLADALGSLADTLAPTGPRLVTPGNAGSLVVPRG